MPKPISEMTVGEKKARIAAIKAQLKADDICKKIKTEGDIHLLNVFRFFRKVVDKNHPLRDAVKAVVFGVLYGKSAKSLGEDTKKTEIQDLRKEINKLYAAVRAGDKTALAQAQEIEDKLTALLEEDRREYAQGIIDKMFAEFSMGYKWMKRMSALAEEKGYVYSPIGRRRYMPAVLTQDKTIISKQVRRGTNAPIQGFASEVGVKASRRIMETFYDEIPAMHRLMGTPKKSMFYRVLFNRIVHDASYFAVPYELVIPFLHVLQYEATYGIAKAYEDEFGVKFTVEPEIEIELSVRDDQKDTKWDWSLPTLMDILHKSLVEAQNQGQIDDIPSVMAKILKPWKDKKSLDYWQGKYPLLNVEDLHEEITQAVSTVCT